MACRKQENGPRGGDDLRRILQQATNRRHKDIDALYSRFDLSSASGYISFLGAHLSALRACHPSIAEFCGKALHRDPPDFLSMIERDLDSVGGSGVELVQLRLSPVANDPGYGAGVSYVVFGSRLGIASLRKIHAAQANDNTSPLDASLYFADRSGLELWNAFLKWSADVAPGGGVSPSAIEGALAAFDIFETAAQPAIACLGSRGGKG